MIRSLTHASLGKGGRFFTSVHSERIIVNIECQTLASREALILIVKRGWPALHDDLSRRCEVVGVVTARATLRLGHLNVAVRDDAVDFGAARRGSGRKVDAHAVGAQGGRLGPELHVAVIVRLAA